LFIEVSEACNFKFFLILFHLYLKLGWSCIVTS